MKRWFSIVAIAGAGMVVTSATACDDDDTSDVDAPIAVDSAASVDAAAVDGPPSDVDGPSSGDALISEPFTISGAVAPSTAGKIVILWSVYIGDDSNYAYGTGSSTGDAFVASLTGGPPPEALNDGLGVGVAVLVPEDYEVPEGTLSEEDFNALTEEALGADLQHAIIYRDPAQAADGLPWADDFGTGFGCGVCVIDDEAGDDGDTFDDFAPAACTEFSVTVDADLENIPNCNWT